MSRKFSNFARAKLATPPSGTGGLSFTVESGKGALFPTLGAGDLCEVVFKNAARTASEVVLVEARTGDAFTIAAGGRGAEGTTAATWTANDFVEMCLTGGALDGFAQKDYAETIIGDWDVSGDWNVTGDMSVPTPATSQSVANKAYADLEHGRCQLSLSGGNLVLNGYNGASLVIDGVLRSFDPTSPPSLAATGATPGTTYNIYAYWSGSAIVLERSTTAKAVHTNGVVVKSGDTTRTLVGKARAVTGPAWANSEAQRFVISWFNRRPICAFKALTTGDAGTSLTSWAELTSDLRAEFLNWGDEAVDIRVQSSFNHTTGGGNSVFVAPGTSGGKTDGQSVVQVSTEDAGLYQRVSASKAVVLSEGYDYATLYAQVGAGAASFEGLQGYNSALAIFRG